MKTKGGEKNMKAWKKRDYEDLAEAYKKGMPASKVADLLEKYRRIDSRGAEICFWNELDDKEAEKIRNA